MPRNMEEPIWTAKNDSAIENVQAVTEPRPAVRSTSPSALRGVTYRFKPSKVIVRPEKKNRPVVEYVEPPFRPPNPATQRVEELKAEIEAISKEISDEPAFDKDANYEEYSLQKSKDKMLSAAKDGRPKESLTAQEKANAWMPVPGETLEETSREGPIRDGASVKFCCSANFSKRSTFEINKMDLFDQARLFKYIRYRKDGITFAEANLELKQESFGRAILTSYPDTPITECERCYPTPATGTKHNPFLFLTAKTAPMCGVKPGLGQPIT